MRTQSESGKATKWVHLGQEQAGTFLIQGELEGARAAKNMHPGPVLALVGKRFPTTSAAGAPLSLVFIVKR